MDIREFFFDNQLNGYLQKLVELGRLNDDERLVVNYHLAGLSDQKIRLIFGKSYQQFLQIESSILEKIDRLKAGKVDVAVERNIPINIEFDAGALSEEEHFVLKCRLESRTIKEITQILREQTKTSFTEEKTRMLERAALRKLRHPSYKIMRRDVR